MRKGPSDSVGMLIGATVSCFDWGARIFFAIIENTYTQTDGEDYYPNFLVMMILEM